MFSYIAEVLPLLHLQTVLVMPGFRFPPKDLTAMPMGLL
jgi:hypothetical protein